MAILFLVIKRNFSQNKYAENMRSEVGKLIGEIQFQTETCVRILEDKIAQANECVKRAENRLEVINAELQAQEKEVVVLDKLMADNAKKIKKGQKAFEKSARKNADEKAPAETEKNTKNETTEKTQNIQIYSDIKEEAKKITSEQVLQMYRSGSSPEEISKKTGMPLGEVSLVISLSGGSE